MTALEKRIAVWNSPVSRAIRDRFGSQAALARHLGVGRPYISTVVSSGARLPIRVAEALGLER